MSNNIFYKINFHSLDDYVNPKLCLLDGTCPKHINSKEWILKIANSSEIQDFENNGLIEFYQNGEIIKWKDF